MENENNPFKSSSEKTADSQNKEQIKITKDQLIGDLESFREPYGQLVEPKNDAFTGKPSDGGWYRILTKEIQQVTDALQKVDDTTSQNELLRIKEKIEGIKIRFNANQRSKGEENLFVV